MNEIMKIEIVSEDDDNFSIVNSTPKIQCKQFGEVWVACDGKRSIIGKTEEDAINGLQEIVDSALLPTPIQEEVVEEFLQPPPVQKGTPIENQTETNSFDWFSGTSWAGKKQQF